MFRYKNTKTSSRLISILKRKHLLESNLSFGQAMTEIIDASEVPEHIRDEREDRIVHLARSFEKGIQKEDESFRRLLEKRSHFGSSGVGGGLSGLGIGALGDHLGMAYMQPSFGFGGLQDDDTDEEEEGLIMARGVRTKEELKLLLSHIKKHGIAMSKKKFKQRFDSRLKKFGCNTFFSNIRSSKFKKIKRLQKTRRNSR